MLTVANIAHSITSIRSLVSIIDSNNLRMSRSHFNCISELLDLSLVFFLLTAALATTVAEATEKKKHAEYRAASCRVMEGVVAVELIPLFHCPAFWTQVICIVSGSVCD